MNDQVKSKAVKIFQFGKKGGALCWAEAAHVLAQYYYPDRMVEFCSFLESLLKADGRLQDYESCCDRRRNVEGKCDLKGVPGVAMAAKCVALVPAVDFWDNLLGMFQDTPPRPRVLFRGNENDFQHVELITGFVNHSRVQGIETWDPLGDDIRRLYLRRYFEDSVCAHRFLPMETLPLEAPTTVRAEPLETPWAVDDLEDWEDLEIQFPAPTQGMLNALLKVLSFQTSLSNLSLCAAYPLEVSNFRGESAVEKGVRFVFRNAEQGASILADLFQAEHEEDWQVGVLTSGKRLSLHLGDLGDYLKLGSLKNSKLRFQRWADLGLDVAVVQPVASNSSFESREIIFLIGQRSYLGLGYFPGKGPRFLDDFIEELQGTL